MKNWIYKCNAKMEAHHIYFGDWEKVFVGDKAIGWGKLPTEKTGGSRVLKGLSEARKGDRILAFQSDRK